MIIALHNNNTELSLSYNSNCIYHEEEHVLKSDTRNTYRQDEFMSTPIQLKTKRTTPDRDLFKLMSRFDTSSIAYGGEKATYIAFSRNDRIAPYKYCCKHQSASPQGFIIPYSRRCISTAISYILSYLQVWYVSEDDRLTLAKILKRAFTYAISSSPEFSQIQARLNNIYNEDDADKFEQRIAKKATTIRCPSTKECMSTYDSPTLFKLFSKFVSVNEIIELMFTPLWHVHILSLPNNRKVLVGNASAIFYDTMHSNLDAIIAISTKGNEKVMEELSQQKYVMPIESYSYRSTVVSANIIPCMLLTMNNTRSRVNRLLSKNNVERSLCPIKEVYEKYENDLEQSKSIVRKLVRDMIEYEVKT